MNPKDELEEPDLETYPIPEPEELNETPIEEFECLCGCTDE